MLHNPVSFFYLDAGMLPFPSTWSLCQCRGTATLVQLCSWPPSSIGSPSFVGAPCDYSQAPPALRDQAPTQPHPRSGRQIAVRCRSLPMATVHAPQSLSLPPTEKGLGWGGGKEGRMYQWVCKGRKDMREKWDLKQVAIWRKLLTIASNSAEVIAASNQTRNAKMFACWPSSTSASQFVGNTRSASALSM